LPRPKPRWSIGKLNSPNYEWFDLQVFMPLQHALRQITPGEYLLRDFRDGREFHDEPLGSHFLKCLTRIVDPLTLVVTAHLFIERFVDGIIAKKFTNAGVILKNRGFTFALKVDLLRAKNYLSEDCYVDIRVLNTIRNRFAHDLIFDLAGFDMAQFWFCEQWNELRISNVAHRREAATYVIRCVAESLLWRLTARHNFLGEIEAPAQLKVDLV
jgi:hypothetical protein